MIIQIDHVALTSNNFDKDIPFWEKLGYNLQFVEKSLKNLEIKKQFLTNYQDYHQLALLLRPFNYSIELLNHSVINNSSNSIFPIFQCFPETLIKESKSLINFSDFQLKEAFFKQYDINIYILKVKADQTIIFNKILIKTNNLQNSVKFWGYLGFRLENQTNDYALLKFHSPLKQEELVIILNRTDIFSEIYLNDKGFNCIAFVSNNSKNEREQLKQKNFFTTKIEQLEVNATFFDIFFAKGPSNEIIEVISLSKK